MNKCKRVMEQREGKKEKQKGEGKKKEGRKEKMKEIN